LVVCGTLRGRGVRGNVASSGMVVRGGRHNSYRRGRVRGWLDRPAPGTSDDCTGSEQPTYSLTSTLSNGGASRAAQAGR
jgi:hypothetical protein